MRKKVLVPALIAAIAVIVLTGCTKARYDTDIAKDGWVGVARSEDKIACLYEYRWDGNEANMRLVVPSEVDGYRITEIGKNHGPSLSSPFYIEFENSTRVAKERVRKDTVKDLVFTLVIGKDVDQIYYNEERYRNDYVYRNEEEEKEFIERTYYAIKVKVELDPANPYFYMKDGKLYSRENDSLVSGSFYVEPAEDTEDGNVSPTPTP